MSKLSTNLKFHRSQFGLSLIEMMVSITISLILLAGTATILVNNSSATRTNDELARLQENLRIANHILTRDLRMAGYFGCPNNLSEVKSPYSPSTPSPGGLLDTKYAIEGSEAAGNWKPSNSTDIVSNIVSGTDAITVRFLRGDTGFSLTENMTGASGVLTIGLGHDLKVNALAAVYDCATTDIFKVSGIATGASKVAISYPHSGGLSKIYNTTASIVRTNFIRYYIGNGSNGPSLYRQIFDETSNTITTQELVEGIEDMQILWGVDNTGDKLPNTFLAASDTNLNWNTVVSIRYALLGRTVNEYGEFNDTNTYDVNGKDVTAPGDRRVRRVLTNTILLRNFLRNAQT